MNSTETAELTRAISDIAIKHTAKAMHEALNHPNTDVFAWLNICHTLASHYINAGFALYRIEFFTACGFDEAIGHYDWRAELSN